MTATALPNQLYAMPPGESVQRLRSDFVALEKMLATLEEDRFTGYLRVFSAGVNGVVLLMDGGVVETLFDYPPVVVTGRRALGLVADTVSSGEGEVDIVSLDPDVVMGVYQMLTAPSRFENLSARFVDVAALLEYLSETAVSGSLVVTNGEEQGVILMREGDLLAAYTSRSSLPESGPEMLKNICQAPNTAIDVRAGDIPGTAPRMQLSSALAISEGQDLRGEVERVANKAPATSLPRRLSDADFSSSL